MDKSYLIILDKNEENTNAIWNILLFLFKGSRMVESEDRICHDGIPFDVIKVDGNSENWSEKLMGKCCSHVIYSKSLHKNYLTLFFRKSCLEYLEV